MTTEDDIITILKQFERDMERRGVVSPQAHLTLKPTDQRQLCLWSAASAPAFEGEYLKCFYGLGCFVEAAAYIPQVLKKKEVPCHLCGAPSRITVDNRPVCRECYAKMEFEE